ncbi:MAG: hypothetical protein ACAH11_10620 [Sphingomonas sp.]
MAKFIIRDDAPGAAETGSGKKGLRWRQAVFLLACLLPAAIICAPPRWPDTPGGTRQLSATVGYKAAADQMARAHLLKVVHVRRGRGQPEFTKIEIDPAQLQKDPAALGDCRTAAQKIRFLPWSYQPDPSAPCLDALNRYAASSYLALDMRQVSQWDLDGDRVTAMLTNAHVLLGAGGPRDIWRGTINYRSASGLARPSLLFSEVGTNRTIFRFTDGRDKKDMPLSALMESEAGAGEGSWLGLTLDTRASDLFGTAAISLQRLGRAVLIGIPPSLGDARVYVDGRLPAPLSGAQSQFDNIRYVALRPDQYLTIEDGKTHKRLTMQLAETPGSISEMPGNRRIREPSLFDVAQRLEQSGIQGDHRASIEGQLHLDLQRRLAAAMTAGTKPGAPPASFRGAVLLMDGLTGEIAAAATFPSEVDQLAAADRQNPNRIEWLRTNFNFQPLTIGSAAKVPFAAAIVQAHPDLLNRPPIPYRDNFTALDGHPLQLPKAKKTMSNQGNGKQPMVDFNRFIAHSNNEFALTLMRRGTVADTRARRWGSASAWPANLWKFACVIPYALVPEGSEFGWREEFAGCSPYLWRDEQDQAIGDRPIPSPWLNLRMGQVDDDFTDFYLNMIGGNRSTWTTANLGQAYARILSGRAMSPRLTVTNIPAAKGSLPIAPVVWTQIASGMANVVKIGTAHSLGDGVLANSGQVYFYAKTGTPDVDQPAGEQGHVIVLLAVRTRSGQPPAAPGDICGLRVMVINLQRDASKALDLAASLLAPGQPFRLWMSAPCRSGALF